MLKPIFSTTLFFLSVIFFFFFSKLFDLTFFLHVT